MTPDDATLMVYADGELDPLMAKRVEQALAADPALAARVNAERALRDRLAGAFAGIADEPVPAALTAQLTSNVVPLNRPAAPQRRWMQAAAVAAALVLGVAVGRTWQSGPLQVSGDRLAATGGLATALNNDMSGGTGATRILASFRTSDGGYCRIFMTAAIDGVACRDDAGWSVRHAVAPKSNDRPAFRQAATPDAGLMAAAQDMIAGEPLSPAAERTMRESGWKRP